LPSRIKSVGIIGTGSFVPERILTNFDLEKMVDTSDEWIRTRSGISERRIVSEDMATSDIATEAAKKALEKANLSPCDIDLIIVATVTPDMNFPATACIVQKNIGAKNAAAFDIEVGCSGFIYALAIACQFVSTGFYKNILIIGAETLSKIVNWKDRNTCVLFGDGAGAAIVSQVEDGLGILSLYLGADGNGGEFLKMPAGGSRMPATKETVERNLHSIFMDGGEVFKFAVKIMANASFEALQRANIQKEDLDLLIPHQANIRIIESAAKRLELPPEKVFVNLHKFGNMSAASIPVALDEASAIGKLKKGNTVLLVAFGAGLTWASCVLKWAI